MASKWMGKSIQDVGSADLRGARRDLERAQAEMDQLAPEQRQQLMLRFELIIADAEAEVKEAREMLEHAEAIAELCSHARQVGIIQGLRMALSDAHAVTRSPMAKADDEIDGRLPWTDYIELFFADRPGLTLKTRESYQSAFRDWEDAARIKGLALRDVTRRHLAMFADYLRDRSSGRGEERKLNRKTIVRTLGHIKTFLGWAVGKRLVTDKEFGTVRAREATREERVERPRRAFTSEEMQCLFDSPLFTGHALGRHAIRGSVRLRDEHFWFFVIAALTGARTEEIATVTEPLVKIGDVDCIDLRIVGKKSGAGARVVPVISELRHLGFIEWAAAQHARGNGLIFNPRAPRTSAAWSKWCNRYIDAAVNEDPMLVLYSLRHSFRQTLRAARLGDELMNKVFGHEAGEVGEGYGRDLSPNEARVVVENVRAPILLDHLRVGSRKA